MSIRKAKKTLKKISAILNEASDKSLSNFERDAIKYQLIKLYDMISSDENEVKNKNEESKHKKKKVKESKKVLVESFSNEMSKSEGEFVEEPIIEKVEKEIEAPDVVEEDIKIVEEPIESTYSDKRYIDPEIEEILFFEQTSNEVSDKLANRPIRDLTKAMGINEYIFTKDFLFDGDNTAFSTALEDLNNKDNFDDAKYLLAEFAVKYNWLANNKVRKVKNFIHLVKRRYF